MLSPGAFRPKLVRGGAAKRPPNASRRHDAALLRLGRRAGAEATDSSDFVQEVVCTALRVLAAQSSELWLLGEGESGLRRAAQARADEVAGQDDEHSPSLAPHQGRRTWSDQDDPPVERRSGTAHRLEAAVRRRGRVVGIVVLRRIETAFSGAERGFVASLADQVAMAQDCVEGRRTVRRLHHRDALQKAVGFAAQQFLMTGSWEQAIDSVLARVGSSAEVSRVYLFRNLRGVGESRRAVKVHEWSARGVHPQRDHPTVRGLTYHELGMSRWEHLLSRGEVILGDVRELPPSERELLSDQQIRSVAAVPVFVDSRWWGFVGFDDCEGERDWSAVDVQVLQTLANLLGTAIQRKQVEEDRQRLVSLVEHGRDFIALAALDGRVMYLNPAGLELVGAADLEEACRHRVGDFLRPEDRAGLRRQLRSLRRRGHWQGELSLRHFSTGQAIPVLFHSFLVRNPSTGAVIGVGTCGRDLRNRRKMESELRKIDKLKAVGVLAGGIAHDFNNILAAILGNIGVARLRPDLPQEVGSILQEAEGACLRARSLTQQLVTFARGGSPMLQPASLSGLLRESAPFALRGSNVRCEFDLEPELWDVQLDPGQISRVIHNLVINARQAMPEGGCCRLEARNTRIQDEDQLPLPPGRYVEVTVRDRGQGIPEKLLSKVLDPFFTTKARGTGLGLATAHSIVEGHRGHLTIESQEGRGTQVRLLLPAASDSAPAAPEHRRVSPGCAAGRVLVMDDDHWVREVACQSLTVLGYECEGADQGARAVELYAEALQEGRRFDVVLMDLTVQDGMGALKCLRKIQDLDPEVRALVSTGYSNDPVVHRYREHGFCGVVAKPYTLAELELVLRRCMRSHEEDLDQG